MSNNLLFKHFATLATAPDGIARLRGLILQLAVQGKLGTQDLGDEPAEMLLKRIHEENKKTILRNDERKFKLSDPVSLDAQNGEIPLGWSWTKLQEIVKPEKNSIKRGPFGSSIIKAYFVPKGYKIYEQKNAIYDDFSIGNYYINDAKFEELKDFEIKPNDIIISCAGTVGKLAIVPENIERGIINQALLKITLNNNIMKNEYFRILFSSFLMRTDTLSDLKGTAMKNIVSLDLLRQIIFPLPPIAEQHRIVAKVDRLMALCDELEARQQQERAGCLKLSTASLAGLQNAKSPEEFGRQWAQVCDAFDLILDCLENVAVLRQTILQLAVQGRLVRQDQGDEPAKKLVERIKKEKERLKKEKKLRGETELSTINHEEIPFSIPMNWVWEKVGNISFVTKLAGFEYTKYISLKDHGEIPVIRAQNVRMGRIEKNNIKYIDLKTSECLERSALTKPAILMTFIGAGIGDVAIFGEKTRWHLVTNVAKIEPFNKYSENIDIKYFLLYLMSNTGREEIFKFRKSTAQPSLSMGTIREINIVLPPLSEQHRIVAKVDALMALCDALEARLKERAEVQGRLAGAGVKQVAGGV